MLEPTHARKEFSADSQNLIAEIDLSVAARALQPFAFRLGTALDLGRLARPQQSDLSRPQAHSS